MVEAYAPQANPALMQPVAASECGVPLSAPRASHVLTTALGGIAIGSALGLAAAGIGQLTGLTDHFFLDPNFSPHDATGIGNISDLAARVDPKILAENGITFKPAGDSLTAMEKISAFLGASKDPLIADLPMDKAQEVLDKTYALRLPDGSVMRGSEEQLRGLISQFASKDPAFEQYFGENFTKYAQVVDKANLGTFPSGSGAAQAAQSVASGASAPASAASSVAGAHSAVATQIASPAVEKTTSAALNADTLDAIKKFAASLEGQKSGLNIVSADNVKQLAHIDVHRVIVDGKPFNMTIDTKVFDGSNFAHAAEKYAASIGKVAHIPGSISLMDGLKWGGVVGGAHQLMQGLGEHRQSVGQYQEARQMQWQQRIAGQQQVAAAIVQQRAEREAGQWAARMQAQPAGQVAPSL